ncbi:carbon-monoxide dehydrogenase medium subunit [Salinihabitans flavidus]|uniref:Carbon-monoxide dehydrogenase medium subunit n=2 Tax=Salinihabitans flavidus TaxID=569882 RepID=A0A1H8PBA1_9RHOB|nr:carbon-monoxide dehydrogenase medium subunit [Salinihabitans flavidus]
MLNLRLAAPGKLIDISGIRALASIGVEGEHLRIGSMVRHVDVFESEYLADHLPLLREAYSHVAHASVRNRGTLGGNVCHADPASELPAVLQALDATMTIGGESGERIVPADDFFVGLFETAVKEGEMLLDIAIPLAAGEKAWGFCEAATRRGDFAYLAVAITAEFEGGTLRDVRAAYAGLADRPMRCAEVEAVLEGKALTPELAAEAGGVASDTLELSGDAIVSVEHRMDLAKCLTARALDMLAG